MPDTLLLATATFAPIQYFSKFLLYNHVFVEQWEHFPKQSYRNRYVIQAANGALTLTVPVVKPSGVKQYTKDVRIDYALDWQKNHFKSIESAYRSSAFYLYYMDEFVLFFEKKHTFLFDFNQQITASVLRILKLNIQITPTETFVHQSPPDCTDLRSAIHPKPLHHVPDSRFMPMPYTQVFSEKHAFMPNLSILDLLFNLGPDALGYLKKSIVV